MALAPAQLTTLKTAILAETDPIVTGGITDGNHGVIANWYNLDASPDYWLFRKLVSSDEIRDSINAQNIADITSADRGRAVDLLAIRLDRGFSGENVFDRSAWDDIFSTAAGDESQQAILILWTRLSTNGEHVFRLSTDTGTIAALADTTSFQGSFSSGDISLALSS